MLIAVAVHVRILETYSILDFFFLLVLLLRLMWLLYAMTESITTCSTSVPFCSKAWLQIRLLVASYAFLTFLNYSYILRSPKINTVCRSSNFARFLLRPGAAELLVVRRFREKQPQQPFLVGALEHFLFSHKLEIIIPIDFHICQRGGSTTNQVCM